MTPTRNARLGTGSGSSSAPGIAELLHLAAAPLFAGMAVVSSLSSEEASDVLCAAAHGSSWLTGMTAMYMVMSLVHLPPWIGWLSRRRHWAIHDDFP